MWKSLEIINSDLKIISIKNFYHVNFLYRKIINLIIEDNYKKYYRIHKGYNFEIINFKNLFFSKLYKKFLIESKKIFGEFDLSINNQDKSWCYKSLCNDYASIYHDHINTSTINAVYYYQIKNGDSISFLQNKTEFTYFPDEKELLIFPNYLLHKPNKPSGTNYCRYSINMEIMTKQSSVNLFNKI